MVSRKELTAQILEIKKELTIPYFDSNREAEIINRLSQKYCINIDFLRKIYNEVFKDSINIYFEELYKNKHQSIIDELNKKPVIIAGPCAVESEKQIMTISKELAQYGIKFLRAGAFKPRTSPKSFQGIGAKGIELIRNAAEKYKLYVVTELLDNHQVDRYYDMIDIIQVGSRNMASYSFLKYLGRKSSRDNKTILLKRGFNSTLKEMLLAAQYIIDEGNPNVILCLRGIRTFEQIDSRMRFTSDLASIIELKEKSNLKVFFDPSHSTGHSRYIKIISQAAICLGADGLLIESHNSPSDALSDAEQCVEPSFVKEIMDSI